VRARNEDAFLVADVVGGAPPFEAGVARFDVGERGALLAVSDGMGGHKAGHVASAMTIDVLFRSLVERTSVIDSEERLIGATERANAEVYEAGRRPSLAKMGATVTAVLVENGTAHIAEVGDSRAYVVRNGEIHRLTLDQSYAQLAVSAGALSPTDVAESPLRNVLVQAMGQATDVSVAVSVLTLRQRDCLVVCSDGLTNKVGDHEIRDLIIAAASLDAACKSLIDLANARGGEDNITVLAAGVTGEMGISDAAEQFSNTYSVVRPFEPKGIPRLG
jgi:serine/threonine protein phosphatase PrpC